LLISEGWRGLPKVDYRHSQEVKPG